MKFASRHKAYPEMEEPSCEKQDLEFCQVRYFVIRKDASCLQPIFRKPAVNGTNVKTALIAIAKVKNVGEVINALKGVASVANQPLLDVRVK